MAKPHKTTEHDIPATNVAPKPQSTPTGVDEEPRERAQPNTFAGTQPPVIAPPPPDHKPEVSGTTSPAPNPKAEPRNPATGTKPPPPDMPGSRPASAPITTEAEPTEPIGGGAMSMRDELDEARLQLRELRAENAALVAAQVEFEKTQAPGKPLNAGERAEIDRLRQENSDLRNRITKLARGERGSGFTFECWIAKANVSYVAGGVVVDKGPGEQLIPPPSKKELAMWERDGLIEPRYHVTDPTPPLEVS